MAANTLDELKPLLDQFDGRGHVLSCYADLSGSDGFRPNWQEAFAREVVAIHKEFPEHDPARSTIDRDLAAIRNELELPSVPAHRWLAVFSAAERGFLRSVPLDVPVQSTLICDRSPYLAPLMTATLRRREYLAVHTDSHRARLYSATPGSVRRFDEIDAEVPRNEVRFK